MRRSFRSTLLLASVFLLPGLVAGADQVAPGGAEAGPADRLPPRALVQLGTDRLRMRGEIRCLAFSPDGRLVAAAGHDDTRAIRVALFDVRTGREVKQLVERSERGGGVGCLAFSPDGTRILTGNDGPGEVLLWDLAEGRLLFRASLHHQVVNAVTFSPDGKLMASAGQDGSVRVRRVARLAEPYRDFELAVAPEPASPDPDEGPGAFAPVRGGVGCLAFTPDGSRIVVGPCERSAIFIWRIADGCLVRRISRAHFQLESADQAGIASLAVTPDGRRIMSAGAALVPVSDAKLGLESEQEVLAEVRYRDLETGKLVEAFRGARVAGYGYAALSRDGRRAAVADFGRLRILDAGTGAMARTFDLPGWLGNRPAFSPDGALVAMPLENSAGLFEVETGRRLHHDGATPVGRVVSAAWSPSSDRVVTGHADGFVRVWEAAAGKLVWHRLLPPRNRTSENALPVFVGFSRDGRLVVAAGRKGDQIGDSNGIIATYEAASGRTLREVAFGPIARAALTPDGRMLVVATSQGIVNDTRFHGVDLGTGRIRWTIPPGDDQGLFPTVAAMQFRSGSPLVEVAMLDCRVVRLNALTGREQRRSLADARTPEQKAGGCLAEFWEGTFSPDGRILAGWGSGGWICAWDVETGALRGRISPPSGCRMALAPDGRTLATADIPDSDNLGQDTIRLIDVVTGRHVLALQPRDDRAVVLSFSPDGTRLFTGFERGTAIIWDVRRGEGTPGAK
jgi:WD40 repeat protein